MSAKEQDPTVEGPGQGPGESEPTPESEAEPRSAGEIRADIDATRDEMGDTVEALAAKTDVKGQARERAQAAKQTLAGKREELTGKARGATPEDAQKAGRQVVARVRENPAPVAIAGAVAVGFLLGKAMSR